MAEPGGQVKTSRKSDLATRTKAAGVVVMMAVAAAAIGFVIFATLWLALIIGLFVLLVGVPLAIVAAKRRFSGSGAPANRTHGSSARDDA